MNEQTVEMFGRVFTKDEWQDVAEAARPNLTQEQYDEMWQRYVAGKVRVH